MAQYVGNYSDFLDSEKKRLKKKILKDGTQPARDKALQAEVDRLADERKRFTKN